MKDCSLSIYYIITNNAPLTVSQILLFYHRVFPDKPQEYSVPKLMSITLIVISYKVMRDQIESASIQIDQTIRHERQITHNIRLMMQ